MATPLLPIVDYPTLLAAAAKWIDRTDMVDVLPICVGFATARFNATLRIRDMERRSVATVTNPAPYVDLPDDFLELKSATPVTNPASPPLASLTLEQLQSAEYERPRFNATPLAVPAYFCVVGTTLALGPPVTTGLTYPLEIIYYGSIPNVSDVSPNNWLLTKAPALYLAQTLVETAPYLRDDDRIDVWQRMADRAMGELQAADNRAALAGGAMAPRSGGWP